jgi:hypothetical protein
MISGHDIQGSYFHTSTDWDIAGLGSFMFGSAWGSRRVSNLTCCAKQLLHEGIRHSWRRAIVQKYFYATKEPKMVVEHRSPTFSEILLIRAGILHIALLVSVGLEV